MKTIFLFLVLFIAAGSVSYAQRGKSKSNARTATEKPKAFHIKQHVMVTMKDGTEVEAVVHSHMSKKKYWVRQWHSGRKGVVKEKYMRALSEGEIAELKKNKKK